ncbi:3-dehydroquinate synthase [Prochlorococcus sp. MIT 1341]|uniref:3-dehydroquinate synthase n=1 Tax=Prochlorococcus sp. MIT 1341 TaxID=3096221 RepID=UPI002A74ACF8|nr:3-dehydroquinate synthase [Prochlorococcus sp. MIT 1341]
MTKTGNRINVPLSDRSYEVVIGEPGLEGLGEEVKKAGFKSDTKILIVSNTDISEHYGQLCIQTLKKSNFNPKLILVDSGEKNKTLESITMIHNAAYEHQLERDSLMIALGGGIVGDMTGFAAATWLRGVAFIQVPTTLLAMVDASIGGKTGVNHPGGKNLIGAFHQPKLVLIDPMTLKTLPSREFRAGMAEVVKYGVIYDSVLFSKLEQFKFINEFSDLSNIQIEDILKRSANAKVNVVVSDELEAGQRAILNYGHTFGHAIEKICGYGNFLHGEAIAIGMVAAGTLAIQKNCWTQAEANRQLTLLKNLGLPTSWPEINFNEFWKSLLSDKKVKEGRIRFILPKGLGGAQIRDDVSKDEIMLCIKKLSNRFF